MNLSAYKQAFAGSHHSPNIRNLRSILGATEAITDFCVPVNIGFPPAEFMEALHRELGERLKYYPSEPGPLREKFAAFLDLPAENLIAGNGSTELFYNILNSSGAKHRLLTCVPTFGRWTDAPRASGHSVVGYARREENQFGIDRQEFCRLVNRHQIDTVIISNPNNPTGHLTSREDLLRLIEMLRQQAPAVDLIIVDESFLDFSSRREEASLIRDVHKLDRVIVLKSLGKSFGLHGARLGVMVGNPALVADIEDFVPYWNVNGVAESVIELMPKYTKAFQNSLNATGRATQDMRTQLSQIPGAVTYPTDANFVYLKMNDRIDPVALRDHLLIQHRLFVRSCGNKEASSARHFRIATRSQIEVARLVNAIKSF